MTGCGTTRWSDTARTATEQLLISNAIDRAISEFDFTILAGREVYFDSGFLKGVTDENYIVSSLRQHLLASGCILRETKEEAEFVIEARSGAVGTDRSDLLFGMPAVTVPAMPGMMLPSTIPEIPLAKSTNQKAVAKLAVFAYNRETGRPVFQTGVDPAISTAKNSWFFGAGPFQKGTVYEGNTLGDQFDIPIIGGRDDNGAPRIVSVPVTDRAIYADGLSPPPATDTAYEIATEPVTEDPSAAARVVRLPDDTAPDQPRQSATPAGGASYVPAPPPNPVQRTDYIEPLGGRTGAIGQSSMVTESTEPPRKRPFAGLGKLFGGKKEPDVPIQASP